MTLRRLCKSANSNEHGESPAVYVAEGTTTMVAQGAILDAATAAELQEVAAGEIGVAMDAETLLRGAALFLAEHGRPAMLAEVDDFLAGWPESCR